MTLCRVVAFGALLATAAADGCRSMADCSGAGACNPATGVCECVAGYTGATCDTLNFGAASRCGQGGLCMTGSDPGVPGIKATWGGSVVKDDATPPKFHMYAAGMSHNCSLGAWLTNSVVVHAVADSVAGPYVPADVSFGPAAAPNTSWDALDKHNPMVSRAPDGTYVVYYMGTKADGGEHVKCGPVASRAYPQNAPPLCTTPEQMAETPVCNQRIGVATAASPAGPWKTSAAPVIALGPRGAWDDLFTANPTVHIYPNNSALMVYKGRSYEDQTVMRTGVAFAEHYLGPFTRATPSWIDVPSNCEDAGMHYDAALDVYRIAFHCGCDYMMAWARDGYNWSVSERKPWCTVRYGDGSSETFARRERPQWVQNDAGTALTHLITAVMPKAGSHGGQTWTLVQELV
eukprot:TRINITY_DN22524_c0_g1_i1.p1 TRINITY_DN22524_c0_g1~~TRINITY_DN22524_c0_g1_i1.p1  ORF type:complete len:404 (+),score=87.55 TRINITY_DN22524_c0_g1_i1:76-1287(+)